MKPRSAESAAFRRPKTQAMLVTRPTQDEQLAASLGYVNVHWPNAKIADSWYPRGVWKCPKTGWLHTPHVIRIMQKPVDPNGKPFAEAEALSEVQKAERKERRDAKAKEDALIKAASEERRRIKRERALLA